MAILVTGGCGYIGSHVVKALSESGEEVVVLDSLIHSSPSALLHGEKLIVGDITDKDVLHKVFKENSIESVIHLAALVNAAESVRMKDEYARVNAVGSENVWRAAGEFGVKHFLYSSSAAVYGTPEGQYAVDEEHDLHPESPYGETKLLGEESMMKVAEEKGINAISFRFFNVGGAEEKGRLRQSKESRAIMQRLFVVVNGEDDEIVISGHDYPTPDGTVVRDFVHVVDISLAFLLGLHYLRKGGKSEILNLGSGESHTIGEVIKEIEVITGKKVPVKYGPRKSGDISYSLADIRKAKRILGWEPVHTLRLIVRDGWIAYAKTQ